VSIRPIRPIRFPIVSQTPFLFFSESRLHKSLNLSVPLRTLTVFQLYMNLKIISAGAGSGKTYRLTQEMFALLQSGVRASGIIATTFTKKAAAELQERVRTKLLEEGLTQAANDLSNALIGTVNSICV
jgi:superfamily I DNA/RNA helicase